MAYLAGLVVAAFVYVRYQAWNWNLDRRGVLAIAWFGILGATVANLNGLTRNARKWNRAWNLSYVIRPLLGGVFGVVGYLIYIAIVQASLTSSAAAGIKRPTILAMVIAFTLGFREEMFRELIRRVVDLVVTGGNADVDPPSPPTDLQVCDDAHGQARAVISWRHATDNVGVVGYNVYRNGRFVAADSLRSSAYGSRATRTAERLVRRPHGAA